MVNNLTTKEIIMGHHHQCHDEGTCGHHHHTYCESAAHESSCCHEESCKTHHHHGDEGDFGAQLLEMADQAWMELLKEKIKEQIEASGGKHLDKLAKVVSETNKVRWQNKMAKEKIVRGFKEKLGEIFNKE